MASLAEYNEQVDAAPERQTFEPLPAGEYRAFITESEIKDTKAGGKRLALKWQIIDGDYDGRYVFDNINVQNKNQKAVDIAMQQLKQLREAVGIGGQLNDSSELHDRPCIITVKVTPERTDNATGNTYHAGNEIKKYSPEEPEAAKPSPAQKATVQRTATPPSSPAKKPWERK